MDIRVSHRWYPTVSLYYPTVSRPYPLHVLVLNGGQGM